MSFNRSESAVLIGAAIAALLATTAGAQVHPEKPTYLPKGTCQRITGGRLDPPNS